MSTDTTARPSSSSASGAVASGPVASGAGASSGSAAAASSARVELVVLDMAGTTVVDDGVVEQAFARTADRVDLGPTLTRDEALQHVRDTMGQSKIEVFRHLTGGDEALAQRANEQFEVAYGELADELGVEPIAGAGELIEALRASGVAVVLTTGFAPATRDRLLDSLGWQVDAALSPVDAGRGRPAPDLVLTALLRTGASSVASVVVVGDTVSDVLSGRSAGAGLVVGVTTGAHGRDQLLAAGADVVLDGVAELVGLPQVAGVLGGAGAGAGVAGGSAGTGSGAAGSGSAAESTALSVA
ncbi:phosphonatase-like hydrolase [Frigoribacterium faeni]|uniref:phosphonatase-like hydrolase n=1 Tax=Frigoribacterium faeni TaxID=145483 RepID=UPI00141BD20F|nr:phosphonatase-like hydrolase [Frigoribacterium faeni]NIJ05466.1 phosphonatase-like hydrolase [Frigoribacterium faeni]